MKRAPRTRRTQWPLHAVLPLIAFLAQSPHAAAAESLAEAPPFSLSPADLQTAAAATPTPANAVVNIIEWSDRIVFEPDGSRTTTSHLIYKVVNPAAVAGSVFSAVTSIWAPWLNDKPRVRARVVLPDGSARELDPATIVDSAASALDPNLFGDVRVTRAPLPALGAGAVVETEYVMVERLPYPDSGVAVRAPLQRPVHVQHVRLSIQAPSSLSLRYRVDAAPGVTPRHSAENGMEQWVFDSGPTVPPDDFPLMVPSDAYIFPTVTFSTGKSWKDVATGYTKIVEEKLSQAKVGDLAARLTKGKTTRDAKIAAIVEFLNHEIRYTGVELAQASLFPSTPAETLSRKYGDCKDKSLLLVALLRSVGIDAHLALLSAGTRLDVAPDLPGIGLFDHAIVRVVGEPALWIDATAETARVGQLPDMDRGRWTLIVDAGTSELIRVDETRSADNGGVTEREIRLAAYGPAVLVEKSMPRGADEIGTRAIYAATSDSKKLRESLASYVKRQYSAKDVGRIDYADPRDFTQPFYLSVQALEAERGSTNLRTAGAYVNLEGLFDSLPDDFRYLPNADEEKTKKERSYDYQIGGPHVVTSRYRIVPPAGFQATKLPPDSARDLGPMRFSERYSQESDGSVTAELRFDSVKRRFTPAERIQVRDAVAALEKRDAVLVNFELAAHALLDQGKLRESFQAYRDLVAKNLKDPIQHLRRADGLLEAGMGEAARIEARLATKLDPKSLPAQENLAWILRHDPIGRRDGAGADYAGAAAAYRTAAELDPAKPGNRANYAMMLEYDVKGNRYGPKADVSGAIREYQKLTREQLAETGMSNNLVWALFYARRFKESLEAAEALGTPPLQIIISSIAEIDGADKALEEARRRTTSKEQFNDTASKASALLMALRDYPLAAVLAEAGASGGNAAQGLAFAATMRKARHHEDLQFESTPEGLTRRAFAMESLAADDMTPETLLPLFSRSARAMLEKLTPDERRFTELAMSNRRGWAYAVDTATDFALATLRTSVSGDDALGYRVMAQLGGPTPMPYYIVKEDGQYRLLGYGGMMAPVAFEMLGRLERHDVDGARMLVAWVRDSIPAPEPTDPYAAYAFTSFWDAGQRDGDARAVSLASAAFAAGFPQTAASAARILEKALAEGTEDAEHKRLEPALLMAYRTLRQNDKALEMAKLTAARAPRSAAAFSSVAGNLLLLGRYAEAEELCRKRLQANPEDVEALRMLSTLSAAQGRYAEAYERALDVTRSGASLPGDQNNLAWLSLFFDRSGGPDIDAATRGSQQNNSGPAMHTLACVYAEMGRAREARDLLIQSMTLRNMSKPDESTWYGFGRLAELYGERDIALTSYSKLHAAPVPGADYQSTYTLAQRRLAILGKKSP
jgi:tetratricopeptide (TPR) repeat protein